jgi:hypothetical protein
MELFRNSGTPVCLDQPDFKMFDLFDNRILILQKLF